MPPPPPDHPDWDRLYEAAAAQEGFFTTRQAADAGYSSQLRYSLREHSLAKLLVCGSPVDRAT